MTERVLTFPVFRYRDGTRFIFPGYNNETDPSASLTLTYCVTLNLEVEKFAFSAIVLDGVMKFEHVKGTARSSSFRMGAAAIWAIGGPGFDADVPWDD